jgi:hypothetical protein
MTLFDGIYGVYRDSSLDLLEWLRPDRPRLCVADGARGHSDRGARCLAAASAPTPPHRSDRQ